MLRERIIGVNDDIKPNRTSHHTRSLEAVESAEMPERLRRAEFNLSQAATLHLIDAISHPGELREVRRLKAQLALCQAGLPGACPFATLLALLRRIEAVEGDVREIAAAVVRMEGRSR